MATKKATPRKVGRPPKDPEDLSANRDRMTVALTTDHKSRLELLSFVLSAREGRRLTVIEAAILALEESPVYQAAMKKR